MNNYNPTARKVGQMNYGWELLDFLGPVELYRNPHKESSFQVSVWLVPQGSHIESEYDLLRVHRYSRQAAEDLFAVVSELMSHLPYEHPLNTYLHPYRP